MGAAISSQPLVDMQFLDSLTGYGVTGIGNNNDTNFIIKTTNSGGVFKTTNGGINWVLQYNSTGSPTKIYMINSRRLPSKIEAAFSKSFFF